MTQTQGGQRKWKRNIPSASAVNTAAAAGKSASWLPESWAVTCYDKLLIQEAAKKSGMDTQFLATHEETMKDMLLPISGNPFADTADMSGLFYFAGDHAYNAEKQAITEIAQRNPRCDRQMRSSNSGKSEMYCPYSCMATRATVLTGSPPGTA